MIVDMDLRGELKNETDEDGVPVSVIEEFLDEAQAPSNSEDEAHEQGTNVTNHVGLPVLLDQHDLVTNEDQQNQLS